MQSPKEQFLIFLGSTKWASIYLFIHPSIHPPTHPYIHHFIYLSVTKILSEHRRHPLLWYEESEIQIRLSHGLSLLLLVAKSCPTLLQPMDCSPPDSSVHGIFQARTLEWAAISFSRGSSQSRDWICVSCIGRWIVYHWATWEAPKSYSAALQKHSNFEEPRRQGKKVYGKSEGEEKPEGEVSLGWEECVEVGCVDEEIHLFESLEFLNCVHVYTFSKNK